MIGIVDYGLGNLTSVVGAVERLGFEPTISDDAKTLSKCQKLILPGVGAFGDGMQNLRTRALIDPLNEMVIEHGKPILGICLGSQLMTHSSEEFGQHEGLGWVDARVRGFERGDPMLRVPHVGWDDLDQIGDSVLFDKIPSGALFYYVHSYHIECAAPDTIIGECEYGVRFVAAFQSGNIFGTQFHPEKSQLAGLNLLKNFLERA